MYTVYLVLLCTYVMCCMYVCMSVVLYEPVLSSQIRLLPLGIYMRIWYMLLQNIKEAISLLRPFFPVMNLFYKWRARESECANSYKS